MENMIVCKDSTVGTNDHEMGEDGAGKHNRPEERGCGTFVGKKEEEEWGEGVCTGLTGGGTSPTVGGKTVEDDLFGH